MKLFYNHNVSSREEVKLYRIYKEDLQISCREQKVACNLRAGRHYILAPQDARVFPSAERLKI